MTNINATNASLRVLTRDKQQALSEINQAWAYMKKLTKIERPKIDALIDNQHILFTQLKDNSWIIKRNPGRRGRKIVKSLRKAIKECKKILYQNIARRNELDKKIADVRDTYDTAVLYHRSFEAKVIWGKKLSAAERMRVLIIAKIPEKYMESASIVQYKNGAFNIYFGGKGGPGGPEHGHCVLDPRGNVRYIRNPWDRHGAHNYVPRDKRPEKNNS